MCLGSCSWRRCTACTIGLNVAVAVFLAVARDALYYALLLDCRAPAPAPAPAAGGQDLSTIHVAYSTDSKNFVGLVASMVSLSLHLASPASCTIHLFIAAADMRKAELLPECLRRELSALPAAPAVLLHELRPLAFDYAGAFNSSIFRSNFLKVPQALVRLYLHEYLPAVPRVLWLDHDTILKADVGQLYRMHMKYALAAAWDASKWIRLRHVLGNCDLDEAAIPAQLRDLSRFNSGVLVFDLDRWRSGNITRAIQSWLPTTSGCDGDQLLLNLEFGHDFDVIDWRWNVLGFNAVTFGSYLKDMPHRCIQEARLFHWNGDGKPWNRSRDTPHRELWDPYAPQMQCSALD
mmetsp:Transcript_118583/g.369395  ORF Transcript_118583/g.369395 Transcript_118583/m.369395 type:complete len:349 (+) Transcript_118583:63-1109(+)